MRYEIFRAGTRTDNSGRTITITPEQVAAIASHYSPDKHEAPIVVGHPSTNAPAYGWVGSLKAENGTLFADFAQVDDDFAELVKKGRYKKVSASFYPPNHPSNPQPENWYLRHVGFLGAHPPAVKGLAAINFADDEDGVVSFGESDWLLSRMLRNLREWLIGKDGLETADRVLPDWQIEAVAPPAPEPDPEPNFSEPPAKDDPMNVEQHEQQLAAERAAREKAEAEAKQARDELAKLHAEQEKSLRDAAHQQNADFAEGLVKAGSLKPADKDLIVAVLDCADYPDTAPADFGEGKKLSDALKDFLRGGAPIVAAGEIATADKANSSPAGSSDFGEYADPAAQSHHERALALAKRENISYEEAARRTVNL